MPQPYRKPFFGNKTNILPAGQEKSLLYILRILIVVLLNICAAEAVGVLRYNLPLTVSSLLSLFTG